MSTKRTSRSEELSRNASIEKTLELLLWVSSQRFPITSTRLREEFELNRRTAIRWMNALEATGVIERVNDEDKRPGFYRPLFYVVNRG